MTREKAYPAAGKLLGAGTARLTDRRLGTNIADLRFESQPLFRLHIKGAAANYLLPLAQ